MNRLLCLAFAGCAALSASAGAGYLAIIGPAPLRFESRVPPAGRARAQLPPLLMQEAVPGTNITAQPAPTNVVTEVVAPVPLVPAIIPPPVVTPPSLGKPPPVVVFPGPLPPPTGPLLGPWVDPNDPNSLLTAQMLIHYFRPQGTNAPGTMVVTPLFIPPRPAASPPSSTVRYSTP